MSDTIFSQIDEAISQLQTLGQDESIHAIRLLRIHARAAEQQVATLTEERASMNRDYAKLAAKRIMENGELAEEVETLKRNIGAMRGQHIHATAELERERDALREELAEARAAIHYAASEALEFGVQNSKLRQQVATLTAENEAMSLDYARLLEQMTSELRESMAQRDALREELAKEKYLHKKALDLGVVFQNAIDDKVDRLERELAEARAEIARLHSLGKVAGLEQQIRTAHAAGVQQGREQEYERWLLGVGGYLAVHNVTMPDFPSAPPAETKDDPYRYGPNQVGNRKD